MDVHAYYQMLRQRLISAVPYSEVSHVGSTAIRGLKSKGDVDVNVRVARGDFAGVLLAIRKLGFSEKQGTLQSRTLRHLASSDKIDLDVAVH